MRQQALALAIGTMGGAAAAWVGLPLPWMLGSMIALTITSMAQVPVRAPLSLRLIMIPVIGVMLGSGFHPSILDRLGDWVVALLILPIFVAAALGVAFAFYRYVGRYDVVTAYFSSAPGGLNDMMLIGEANGGDERRIALAHASRILVVVLLVAAVFGLIYDVTAQGDARPYIPFSAVAPVDLAILIACAVLGAWLGPRLRLQAPQLLGPMILSGAVHITGLTEAPPPSLAVNAAQVVMGTVIGCRFSSATPKEILRDLTLALFAVSAMLIVAVATAYAISQLSGASFEQGFLAFSPGGLPEMSLLALAMHADVAFVATMHTVRIVTVVALAPLVFKFLGVGK